MNLDIKKGEQSKKMSNVIRHKLISGSLAMLMIISPAMVGPNEIYNRECKKVSTKYSQEIENGLKQYSKKRFKIV